MYYSNWPPWIVFHLPVATRPHQHRCLHFFIRSAAPSQRPLTSKTLSRTDWRQKRGICRASSVRGWELSPTELSSKRSYFGGLPGSGSKSPILFSPHWQCNSSYWFFDEKSKVQACVHKKFEVNYDSQRAFWQETSDVRLFFFFHIFFSPSCEKSTDVQVEAKDDGVEKTENTICRVLFSTVTMRHFEFPTSLTHTSDWPLIHANSGRGSWVLQYLEPSPTPKWKHMIPLKQSLNN